MGSMGAASRSVHVQQIAFVFRTRAARRLTEDRSWSADAVTGLEWTPWRTAETTEADPQGCNDDE